MQATTSGASDQNMSRPSCSNRGFGSLGTGPGWLVTALVSQLVIDHRLLGQSPHA